MLSLIFCCKENIICCRVKIDVSDHVLNEFSAAVAAANFSSSVASGQYDTISLVALKRKYSTCITSLNMILKVETKNHVISKIIEPEGIFG